MLPLLLVPLAHATCALEQLPTPEGVIVTVRALAEPVGCRTVTLRSDAPLNVTAWVHDPDGRKRRLRRDHLRALPGGGWELGAPELVPDGWLTVDTRVHGGSLVIQLAPASASPPTAEPGTSRLEETRTIELDLPHPGWGFADPKRGRTHVEQRYTFIAESPGGILALPLGAAAIDTGGLESVPLGVRVPAGAQAATLRYTVPGATAQGSERIPPGTLTLLGTDVSWTAHPDPGVPATPVPGGLRFDTATGGRARWRVLTAGEDKVIPDVATFLAGLDWRFARVSLPEPAVPMNIRGRQDRALLLEELVGEVRALRAGALPGAEPLFPRALNAAWRSGWATSVERGLILHRFLGQEKLPATWVLTGEEADLGSLTGFDTLLLRVGLERDAPPSLWIDPACTVCAPGELGTRWMGRPAIGAAETIPRLPGRLSRELSLRGERFHASFQASGAAALWLREAIVGVEPAVRVVRLATLLGLEDAELITWTGFETAGAPITLEFGSERPPGDPFPDAVTPWEGGWGSTP